ncbi:peptidoglycan-binding protein [Amycolatopsis magusensis]|uniref:Peptidoglycan hydrolase-like protein with peptidoglycan-binding domain n=1 Tax=Amycolatopsis magusensis TaxID=882444 RepID=A0ABS4PJI8_9PSEU|nr:peptidoglycan-binding protein [Amycolatopsis magusensis]MBP2179018.1 peptidoglycan hydrolase-like protein with peptidoglycan-binding domain [Amycolatopsis magusensis]
MTEIEQVRRGRRTRWLLAALAGVAVLGTGAVVVVARVAAGSADEGPPPAAPVETVEVTRDDLAEQAKVDGTLGYGAEREVAGRKPGTITWLPGAGEVVDRGEPVYKVDDKPVPLFYGVVPFYRELGEGAGTGPDVKVLEENLRDLGFGGFGKPDEKFTAATATAVRKWQKSLEQEQTGRVAPADVVVDSGALRVSSVSAKLGGEGTGPLLKATGTERVVTLEVEVAKQGMFKTGDKVDLSIAGGKQVKGTVSAIGTEVETDSGEENAPGAEEKPKVAVTVTLDDPATAGFDAAPVEVVVTTGQREGVLVVPVGALLALAEGGYAVEVVEGAQRRLVAVDPGLFAGGKVEVSGDGLAEGTKVVTTS